MIYAFQIYDSFDSNEDDKYIINLFGRTEDNKSVYVKINKFEPYFYTSIPNNLQKTNNKDIIKIKMYDILKEIFNIKKKKELIDNIDIKIKKLKSSEGFTNDTTFYYCKLVFNNTIIFKKVKNIIEQDSLYKLKLYEANLLPLLRFYHLRNIGGCNWVEINNYKEIIDIENESEDIKKNSYCDIELETDWNNINGIKKDTNAPLRIASFDIECTSCDGNFPQADREHDYIIQIGITYTLLGSSIPYKQIIFCLNNTDKLDNIQVVSCKSEDDLIIKFFKDLVKEDCDIITGYNIFFFDENYIYNRINFLLNNFKTKLEDITVKYENKTSIIGISKLKNYESEFKTVKLASSALGENILKFFDTPGRIHIDVMKDIQKTFTNLSSTKLDYVSSYFIRGDIYNYNIKDDYIELECKTTQDIFENDYIHIEVNKGFISDDIGDKYLIKKIENNKLYIDYDDDLIEELKDNKNNLIWSQAKDDVGPKDIFRLFKGSSNDRSIVAKYCVKDCKLVSLLINKLEIITKNIEMANVCYVPLSYLFLRGQGIKIFSLCSKEFMEQKYVFPVIKKKNNYICRECKKSFVDLWICPNCYSNDKIEEHFDEEGYDGALVFEPIPKIDYEAYATKDYMSLYPSSIMHKNMSHETIVENKKYDNIEGIIYYNASYIDSDGNIQYRRYAKKDDKLGVIPTILDNLLKERKNIKKLMKNERDPFKYKILDAKQLAVKITANSLYGQLGASTSQICKKDIAACTTSTGREMLYYAKKYDEEILPWIINGLIFGYKNNKQDLINKIYELELKDKSIINDIQKFINSIQNYIFQPIIRYGDTDSIFSCYKFKENYEKINDEESLILFQKLIKFGREIVIQFMDESYRNIFNKYFNQYYKIDKLEIPNGPEHLPEPEHNEFVLEDEERIKQFINEYFNENFLPWFWTLQDYVLNNINNMYHNKYFDWAKHLFDKYRIPFIDYRQKRINEINQLIFNAINNVNAINNIDGIEDILKYIKNYENIQITIKIINKIKKNIYDLNNDDKRETKIKKFLERILTKYECLKSLDDIYILVIKNNNDSNNYKIKLYNQLLSCNENITQSDFNEIIKYIDRELNKIEELNINNVIEIYIKALELDKDIYIKDIINRLETFINNEFKNIWIIPRWDLNNNNDIIRCIDIYKNGVPIIDKRSVEMSIDMGEISGELIKKRLPYPHDLEYEKTFHPFLILTKKKYVGNKYEFDKNKYKRDFMGIVLKKRDNAPIVKEICGGIIDILIKGNKEQVFSFVRKCLEDMFNDKYNIKYFVITKKIKSKDSYKNWKTIPHIVLTNRCMERDFGNAPQIGDRLEYVYIKTENKTLLQGDRIETIDFIKKNNLKIDYMTYLRNQIMNPALQFLELVDKNAINIFNEFINKYDNEVSYKNEIRKRKLLIRNIKLDIKEINKKLRYLKLNIKKKI
jgi:DNA polymerase elongation subunit (family B)